MKAIGDLRQSLRALNSGLVLDMGLSHDLAKQLLPLLSRTCGTVMLYYNVDYGCGAEEEAEALEVELNQAATDAGERGAFVIS